MSDNTATVPYGQPPETSNTDMTTQARGTFGMFLQAMYISLTMREVQNRVQAKQEISDFLLSAEGRMPAITYSADTLRISCQALEQRDLATYARCISKIIGAECSLDDLNNALNYQKHLSIVITTSDEVELGPHEFLASVISCLDSNATTIEVPAHWHAKENSSKRPMTYLLEVTSAQDLRRMPEAYAEYWFRRFTLTMARLFDAQEVWEQYVHFEKLEAQQIHNMLRTNNIKMALQHIDNYFDRRPTPFTYNG